MEKLLTGNEAAALAVKLSGVQVIAAYPITPQTSIAEKLASSVAADELKARYLKVESETSALAAVMGGSLSGARVFSATSSQGLALMHELLHWSSGARLPIVMVNVNRSMAAPWSLGTDHNDTLSQRDTGWMQFYCETAQEVLDSIIIAYKLAEKVNIPAMVCLDGFLLSHYSEPVEIPDQEAVDSFLPARKTEYKLDPDHPATYGGGVFSEVLYKLKRRLQTDMEASLEAYQTICREYNNRFKRLYQPVEVIGPESGDLAIIAVGTLAGTVKAFLKTNGHDLVSLIKLRLFRPFPAGELINCLSGFKKVLVLDRNLSPGAGGIVAQEIKSALYNVQGPPVISVISGLGGVDVGPRELTEIINSPELDSKPIKDQLWMGE